MRKFNIRGFVSVLSFVGFLLMAVTGIILYIVPQGRIAYWVDWHLMGLTKTQWGNIHVITSVLFVVAGVFHVYYNWKPMMSYTFSKLGGLRKLKKEALLGLLIGGVVTVSAMYDLPPLSYIVDISDRIKDSWIVSPDYEPPFGHAELMSVKKLAAKTEIDPADAMKRLTDNGIVLENAEETLEEIAVNNDISPMQIYKIMKGEKL